MIRMDQLRGLGTDLEIVDAEALGDSLQDLGADAAQVEALRRADVSLDTYVALIQLEMACLRSHGIEPADYQVATVEYGIQLPTYSFPSTVAGLAENELSAIQLACQNAFTGAYQSLYKAKVGPSAEEALSRDIAAANKFIECARQRGVVSPISTVEDARDFEVFYAWYSTPEADIDCRFIP
jgi:hypothetical protein